MEGDAAAPARRGASPGATAAAPSVEEPSCMSIVASGCFSRLAEATSTGKVADGDQDVDMDADEHKPALADAAPMAERFLPLLTRLQHARRSDLKGRSRRRRPSTTADSAATAVDTLLLDFDEVNTLRAYAAVFDQLDHEDVERFGDRLGAEAQQQQTQSLPLYRRFESSTLEQRACLVLHTVRAFASAPVSSTPPAIASGHDDELFLNDIYRAELAAVLVFALASPKLQKPSRSQQPSPFRRAVVVKFCLTLPVGADLIASIVENDPASSEEVLDTIALALAQRTKGISMAQQEREALSQVTELPVEVIAVQDAAIALAGLSPFHAVMVRDKLRAVESLWAVAVVLHLLTAMSTTSGTPPTPQASLDSLSSLRDDTAVLLLDWIRAPASPLLAFLRIAASRRNGEDKSAVSPPPFQQMAEHLLELLKDQLLDDLETASTSTASSNGKQSPLALSATLGVWISLLSLGNLRLTDTEAMRLVRSLERLTRLPASSRSARIMSLAFVIILLVCCPLAPVLSKIPSQRDESTKAVASLAQHCVVALYNASSAARPMLIVSAVLLYTKSPALLSLLASVIGGSNAFVSAAQPTNSTNASFARVEYLHVVGDVVLKQVLTENLMARDILTDSPPLNVTANDRDQLRDMPLRAIHGLLCEKSFLRYHHGRRLEAWLARMIGGTEQLRYSKGAEHEATVGLPIHPLLLGVLLEWIDNYVMAFEYPIAQSPTLHLSIVPLRSALVYRWLSAPCLHAPFQTALASSEERTTWARALLVLTYALQFNQRLRHAMEVPGSKLSAVSASMSARDDAPASVVAGSNIVLSYELDAFPLHNMLVQAMASGGAGQAFEFIAPTLHRLMMDEFPGRAPLSCLGSRSVEQDIERAWFQNRGSILSRSSATTGGDGSFLWTSATLKAAELRDAPIHVVRREFFWLVASLLPQAVSAQQKSLPQASMQDRTIAESGGVSSDALAFCRVITELFASRLRCRGAGGWSSDPDMILRLVHALCYPDWMAKQFVQQQQLERHGRVAGTGVTPLVVTFRQLLEAPFRIVRDAERAVFRCPPLLELLLLLVRDVRHASNAQLARSDPTVGLSRVSASLQQQQAAQQLPDAMTARSTSIQQHRLVQDCLLTHELLGELAAMTPVPSVDAVPAVDVEPETTESSLLLCAMIDELFAEDAAGSGSTPSPSKQPCPPRLLMAVHTQGYDPRVVPVLMDRAPSLRFLWAFWMQSKSASSRATNSGGNGGSNASSATSKPLMDFLVGDGGSLDKNSPRAGFRLSVFLSLSARYMSVGECAVVAPAMKTVWNKLRAALASSSASAPAQGAGSSKPGANEPFARVDGSFLLVVLPLASRACARHPDLSAELIQFLLKLQKLLPSGSPGGADSMMAGDRRLGSSANSLERALQDAYHMLLQQMGA